MKALPSRPVLVALLRGAALPLSMLFAIGVIVPIRLDTNVATEYWLMVVIHDAFVRGLRFGVDVVLTFGPWGILVGGFHPQTVALMFVLRTAIVVIGVLALWRLSGRRWLIAVLPVVVHICWTDTFLLFIPLLVLLAGFEDEKPAPYYFLVGAGALLSLAKFSFLVMVVVAVVAVTFDEVRRRSRPWTGVCYAVALAVLWLLARQRPSDFIPFVRYSLELASGYGEAMGRESALYAPPTFLPFLISGIAFTIILGAVELRTSAWRGLLLLGGWLALLFLLFKSAFVRADHYHIAPACGAMLLIQLTYLTLQIQQGRRRARLLLFIPIALSIWVVEVFGEHSVVRDVAASIRASANGLVQIARWPGYRGEMERIHRAAVERSPVPPRAMQGDLYPAPTGVIFRNGFRYQPRPVFVSYAVYTPSLAALNARWLAATLPETILFDIETIDRRWPSLQDGAWWPILMTRYAVAGRLGPHVVLERRRSPGPPLVRTAMIRARFAERVRLSTDGALFARVAIDLTTIGRIEKTLYKTPPLRIRVALEDGTEKSFRFVRQMAQSEFLLSPLVEDRDAFADLMEGRKGRAVVWFSIDADPPSAAAAYEPAYQIELLGFR